MRLNAGERFISEVIMGQKGRRSKPHKHRIGVISNQHSGKAAECLVAYELLMQGFDVHFSGIDKGVDLILIKKKQYFLVQVKTSKLYGRSSAYNISKSTFSGLDSKRTFFIFVLRNNEIAERERFLILPYSAIKGLIRKGEIRTSNSYDVYQVSFRQNGSEVFLKNRNLTEWINRWNAIRI